MGRVVSAAEVAGLRSDGRRHAWLLERFCITARVIPNEYPVGSECGNAGCYRTATGGVAYVIALVNEIFDANHTIVD